MASVTTDKEPLFSRDSVECLSFVSNSVASRIQGTLGSRAALRAGKRNSPTVSPEDLAASLDEMLGSLGLWEHNDLEPVLDAIVQKSNSELREEFMAMLAEVQKALHERLSQFRAEPSESMAVAMRPTELSDAAREQIAQLMLQEPDDRLVGRKMESVDAGDLLRNLAR